MKISFELKMKIISNRHLMQTVTKYKKAVDSSGFNVSYPLCKESTFIVDFHKDLHLLEECKNWFSLILPDILYIDIPQVNVGCFKGVFPIKIDLDNKVTFIYHVMDPNGDS